MPFPDSDRVIYEHNPLEEVICQLRFPTILEIGVDEPAAFQKLIRSEYPLYRKEDPGADLPPELGALISNFPLSAFPRPAERTTHKFLTADSKRSVSLTRDFVAVADSHYTRWEELRAEILRARRALEEVYEPAFYTRVGLRYRNVIDRDRLKLAGTSWEELLKPALAGPLGAGQIRTQVRETRSQVRIELDNVSGGTVMLRHGLVTRAGQEPAYLIDADFFTQERNSGDDTVGSLDAFNRLGGNLLRWAITDRLHMALDPRGP